MCSNAMDAWKNEIHSTCETDKPDIGYLKTLIRFYENEVSKFASYHERLDELCEKEMSDLIHINRPDKLPGSLSVELGKEYDLLMTKIDIGLQRKDESLSLQLFSEENLVKLRDDFYNDCPLLADVFKVLFPHVEDNHEGNRKQLTVAHAVNLLMNLKNKTAHNDVRLVFSIMLISFGVGPRLINMLCKMGLTNHWKVVSNFLDHHIERKMQIIAKETSAIAPVIFLLDNINVYRGQKKYHRLFKTFGPKMWNFTGRGILIPNIDSLEHLFQEKDTAMLPQENLLSEAVMAESIFIENNKEHKQIWDEWRNHYLLKLLFDGLNNVPKDVEKLDEQKFNAWLKAYEFKKSVSDPKDCKIVMPDPTMFLSSTLMDPKVTKTHFLELSFENNSTVSGTGAILDETAKLLGIPYAEKFQYLPFDELTKKFSIKQAREHYEYLRLVNDHRDEMADFEKLLENTEKKLDGDDGDNEDERNEDYDALFTNFETLDLEDFDEDSSAEADNGNQEHIQLPGDTPVVTLDQKWLLFGKEDQIFSQIYRRLQNKMYKHAENNKLNEFVESLLNIDHILSVKDHLGRSLLHVAVEEEDKLFFECIFSAGFNPNATEHCGATPLILAVIKNNVALVKLLVEAGAAVRGDLFRNIPSPLEIARKLELAEVYEELNPDQSDDEDFEVRFYDHILQRSTTERNMAAEATDAEEEITRASKGFLTGVVGDVGTCKSNRSVMERSGTHDWVAVVPGDLHMKGSLCE